MKILTISTFLCKFYFFLCLNFSKPQKKNFLTLADALLFSQFKKKTIANLTKMFINRPNEFALAGFFHSSTWNPDYIEENIKKKTLKIIFKEVKKLKNPEVVISIDDTTIEKYKDSIFELCDWVYDHSKRRYIKGLAFVTLRISFSENFSFTIFMRPYISKNKVLELNKKYGDDKYTFKTKNEIAIEMLNEIFEIIPNDIKKYVCFDSWYSSRNNINFCIEQNATVICGLKSNRTFDDKIIRKHFNIRTKKGWTKKQVHFCRSTGIYYIKSKIGKLKGIKKNNVRIIASRLHLGTKHPVYFLCTDCSLSVIKILERYAKRWECETDYLYLKTRLGLADFRVRSALAIKRYVAIVHFIHFFLQYRQMLRMQKFKHYVPLSEIITLHRNEHKEKTIKAILRVISSKNERKIVKKLLDS